VEKMMFAAAERMSLDTTEVEDDANRTPCRLAAQPSTSVHTRLNCSLPGCITAEDAPGIIKYVWSR
jgi:hypothetical protein